MPQTVRGSQAPSGLNVRIDRVRLGGLALRTWTTWIDATHDVPLEDRHDIVLVHGLGVSSQYFERLAVVLGRVGAVHLLDLPGFAGVPRPHGHLEITDFAELIARWVQHAGLERPTFVGHSMGSQIVTEVLASHPGIATHAVLVGPPVNSRERSVPLQAARLLQSSWHESARTRAVALQGYVECGPHWFASVLPRMLRYPIEERLPAVDVPVVVVRGEHDHVAPRAWVAELADLAPQGRWVEVPGASHAVIYEHSRQVADLVLEHVGT
ncbi:alpha/beta fold hydrolase [Cellulomonas oligotrophica]|uniref:Dihydrolipoamide acetyltransferase n=1 Tax=Cellulomonas oligotrophica TaxID=931536 RepID=A0A7Y9FIE5_9CELL|nr:alpha/beta fold hydrolase [Cellulomonas oligotrophica]NYD87893.1 pimeloyl-ACP methyl ester carboxylesterase [Cellulomonas oligotrophica]GIG32900.1 dihydrolipoamide acetyltransferase [Cellulomonas oligotrophica]